MSWANICKILSAPGFFDSPKPNIFSFFGWEKTYTFFDQFWKFHSEILENTLKFDSEMRLLIPKSIPKCDLNFGMYTEISEKEVGHIRGGVPPIRVCHIFGKFAKFSGAQADSENI